MGYGTSKHIAIGVITISAPDKVTASHSLVEYVATLH